MALHLVAVRSSLRHARLVMAMPMCRQWELYNMYDNQGELTANRQ
jgi:hypothetical protein